MRGDNIVWLCKNLCRMSALFFKHCLKLSLEDRPLFWIIRDFCCWCIVCFVVVIFFLQWSSYSYIYWQNRILILLMSVYESKAFLIFFLKLRYLGVYCSINDNVNLGPFKIHMVYIKILLCLFVELNVFIFCWLTFLQTFKAKT